MKFTHKIIISSTILLIGILSVTSFIQHSLMNQGFKNQVSTSVPSIMSGVESELSIFIQEKTQFAQFVVNQINSNPTRDMVAKVSGDSVTLNNFELVAAAFEEDGKAVTGNTSWTPPSSWDGRTRPWYQQAKEAGKLIITPPYVDATTKSMIISLAAPIYNKQKAFIGAIFFDISLSGLAEVVNKVNLFNAGNIIVATRNGVIVADTYEDHHGKKVSQVYSGLKIDDFSQQEITINGRKFLFHLSEVPGTDYVVIGKLDYEVTYKAISEVLDASLISIIVAVIISSTALLMIITKLIRPLSDLNDALRDIAVGDGDLTKKLNENTDHEFSQLAKNFNIFTNKLRNNVNALQESGISLRNLSQETFSTSQRSESAMIKQGQEIEQLATAMHEMSATANDVANNAQNAASAATKAGQASDCRQATKIETATLKIKIVTI